MCLSFNFSMRISPITNNTLQRNVAVKTSIKNNDAGGLGFTGSAADKLFEKLVGPVAPSGGRLEEHEMEKLLDSMLNRGDPDYCITNEKLRELNLCNLKKLPNTKNSYSGMFCHEYSALKEAGINRVIAIETGGLDINALKSLGMEGLRVVFNNPDEDMAIIFSDKEYIENEAKERTHIFHTSYEEELNMLQNNLQEGLNTFVKFIQMMQQDDLYIGCPYGSYRTSDVLHLNRIFNPKAGSSRDRKYLLETLKENKDYEDIRGFYCLYQNLEPQHKEAMGWTPEFDKELGELLKRSIEFEESDI